MLFGASFVALLGLACASPAPKLSPRQSGPNYPVYTFDQLVRSSIPNVRLSLDQQI